MKLLICTQAVDKNHPILGFFHRWIEEFAKHCEEVHVICLVKGEYSLPSNVHVYSLGKEEGENRLKYLYRFYTHIWRLRNSYDNVFVHMNQIYAVLGTVLWKLLGKKVGLWYMHKSVTLSLKIAEQLVDHIFSGSEESFRIPSKKLIITGHGIDTEHFVPQNVEKDLDLISVGRISHSKNVLELVEIFAEVYATQNVTLTLIGEAMTQADQIYKEDLKRKIDELGISRAVNFVGAVTQADLPNYLNRAKIFVHTAQNGSLDKSILEALSVGIPIVTISEGAASLPLGDWWVTGKADFVARVQQVLQSNSSEQIQKLRDYVQNEHGILTLIPKILGSYK